MEQYLQDNLLALCLPSSPYQIFLPSSTESVAESVLSAGATSSQAKKAVQFIPPKMLASLIARSEGSSSTSASKPSNTRDGVRFTNASGSDKTELEEKEKVNKSDDGNEKKNKRWMYSDWQKDFAPGSSNSIDSSSTSSGVSSIRRQQRRQRRKEQLAQRVSAGWGCCLDCGAGAGGSVTPCEVSGSCLLLLRELRETILLPLNHVPISVCDSQQRQEGDIDFDVRFLLHSPSSPLSKTCAVFRLQWQHFESLWTLLGLAGYRDCVKFHALLYEEVTRTLACWFPACVRSSTLAPPATALPPPSPGTTGLGVGVAPLGAPSSPFLSISSISPPTGREEDEEGKGKKGEREREEVVGERRLALWEAVRGVLLAVPAKAVWLRDGPGPGGCMGGDGAREWRQQILRTQGQHDAHANMGSAGLSIDTDTSNIDIHSPQKDGAIDACLKQIREVYGMQFVKELLLDERDKGTSK